MIGRIPMQYNKGLIFQQNINGTPSMNRYFSMVLIAFFAVVSPSLALDESVRLRLHDGEGCPGCDLSNENLNGSNLANQDLSNANLSGANLNSTELYNTNLSGANLTNASVRFANLTGANFSGANLTGANFSGVDALNADNVTLTNATMCSTTWIDGSVNNQDC